MAKIPPELIEQIVGSFVPGTKYMATLTKLQFKPKNLNGVGMAVTINTGEKVTNGNDSFFKVFSPDVFSLYSKLKLDGIAFQIQFHQVVAFNSKTAAYSKYALPVNSTKIMKMITTTEKAVLEAGLKTWLTSIQGPEAPVKAVETSLLAGPPTMAVTQTSEGVSNPAVKISTSPIPLASAQAIYQPVRGTSEKSIYWTVGIGPRIKMAIRHKPNTLSVRVEGSINDTERQALVDLGFGDNGTYLSCHFNLGAVPVERILGVLFFHPQLAINSKIPSLADLNSAITTLKTKSGGTF